MKQDRRSFLKTGLLLGGAALTAPYVNGMSKWADPVRIGVIGTGDRGSGIMHLINEIEGLEVVAISDIIPFRLAAAQEIVPSAEAYEDYQALLDSKLVDAVIVATPFSTHDEIAIDALQAEKHVYCEKTMVKGISQIQSVIDEAARHDVVFQTGHQYHSSRLYNTVRNIVRTDYIGEITGYECQWNRNGDWRRPVPDPKWERMINWRMYKEYSGGLVAELMSHQIDFINWVSRSQPDKIVGFGGIDHWHDGRETFDNAHLMFTYPNGMDASFTCTTTNGFEDYQIKILGSEATIILDYTKGVIYKESPGGMAKGIVDGVSGATVKAWENGEGAPIDAPSNDPTIDALTQFRDSISKGARVVSDIKTGATTAKCVQIALDSLHEGGVRYWKDYPELNFN